MNLGVELTNAIASLLATEVKAQNLPTACSGLGLADGDVDDAFRGKARYVLARLEGKSPTDLMTIGAAVLKSHERFTLQSFQLKEALRFARAKGLRRITEITRANLCEAFSGLGSLSGKLDLVDFLKKLWPIDAMQSQESRYRTLGEELFQHTVRNDDWSTNDVLDRLEVPTISDEAFGELLALLVHPTVRQGEEQQTWLDLINKHVQVDGFRLRETQRISGHPVYVMGPLETGVRGSPKNLIFASSGPKPEIVLADAVNNDIRVVRNEQFCLFYDEPIGEHGLTWHELVGWWSKDKAFGDAGPAAKSLYRRLFESMKDSEPERVLFRAYYATFKGMGARLPALVPQVYLHFDPLTARDLYGEKRLARQRMDFLLFLPHGRRVVIEVDGAQHYSDDNGHPAPHRYAEMVEADRQLRLHGYEVYRFGGAELQRESGPLLVEGFFKELFKKHNIS
ncbi:MAG TPA: hypothetical protein VHB79_32165 [Polyangiaceae bacterium]|nr:hypothetical protein [Polyangiaceae bacterium]